MILIRFHRSFGVGHGLFLMFQIQLISIIIMKLKVPNVTQIDQKNSVIKRILPMLFGGIMSWACFAPFLWFTFTDIELFFICQSIVWIVLYVVIPIYYIYTIPNLNQYVRLLRSRWFWIYGCSNNQIVPEIVIEAVE